MFFYWRALSLKLEKAAYKPAWFLASLGAGGLSVAWFLWFMFLIPPAHYQRVIDGVNVTITAPLATVESIKGVWGDRTVYSVLIVFNYAIIAYLMLKHVVLLVWNLVQFFRWLPTRQRKASERRNEEVGIMAVPLTLAMFINVGFVFGAIGIPGLWNKVESIFPVAIVLLNLVGIYALYLFVDLVGGFIVFGGFDCDNNRNLSQMLSVFTFSMVAVGLAGPAAMSHNVTTSAISSICSIFYLGVSVLFSIPAFVMGMRSMLIRGISHEAAASLVMLIPIFTLWAITLIRLRGALEENFATHISAGFLFFVLTFLFMLETLFAALGAHVFAKIGYFSRFIHPKGEGYSALVYGIICPFVAFGVLGQFWVHKGMIAAKVMQKFSGFHWTLLALILVLYIATWVVMEMADYKMFVKQARNASKSDVKLEQIVPPTEGTESLTTTTVSAEIVAVEQV